MSNKNKGKEATLVDFLLHSRKYSFGWKDL